MNTNLGVLSESSNEMPFVVNTLLFHCLFPLVNVVEIIRLYFYAIHCQQFVNYFIQNRMNFINKKKKTIFKYIEPKNKSINYYNI